MRFTAGFLLLAILLVHSVSRAAQIACPVNTNPSCAPGFPVEFSGGGIPADVGFVQMSSPAVARLGIVNDNKLDIVVGTTGGYLVAYHGDGTFLWAHKTGTVRIQSKPVIADVDGDGTMEVVAGAGAAGIVGGGLYILHADGSLKCAFTALDTASGGIYSSPAVGHLDPQRPNEMQIVFGSFDKHVRALRPDCSVWWSKGVADDVIDTIWSSPGLYDLDRDGKLDVVIGIDSGQGTLPNGRRVGGQIRAFRGTGSGELAGFPIKLDEVVYSSPAIGDVLGNGSMAVAVGNGRCWDLSGCAPGGNSQIVTEALFGWSAAGTALAGWPYAMLAQSTRTSSPAFADLDGDGKLETVISTLIKTGDSSTNDKNGYIHVVRSNGTAYPGWPVMPATANTCSTDVNWGPTFASPIAVDLDGDAIPEIVAPVATQVSVWRRDGTQLSYTHVDACGAPNPAVFQLRSNSGIFSTPTAADIDGDGKIELVAGSASTLGGATGALFAWKFPSSIATAANMPWGQFRHDIRNTGVYVGDAIFSDGFEG